MPKGRHIRVEDPGIKRTVRIEKPTRVEFMGFFENLCVMHDGPNGSNPSTRGRQLGRVLAYHEFVITYVPFGIKYPSYSSSLEVACNAPNGTTVCHL